MCVPAEFYDNLPNVSALTFEATSNTNLVFYMKLYNPP